MEGPVHPASGGTRAGSLIEATVAVPRTDLQLRNYDDTPYALELVVRDDDGVALTREYDLDPGECRAERGVLDPGTYEVRAMTADGKRDSATCRVRTDPAATISVEVGNHVVNVLEGI